MYRVRTPLFGRNPYLFSDQTWGLTYVLHGLAGVGFVGLVIAHIYFALRPEKLWITKSMIFGRIRVASTSSTTIRIAGVAAVSDKPMSLERRVTREAAETSWPGASMRSRPATN